MDTQYTIEELSTQSGISRRTIHFYVQQGVLPAPAGAGLGARYTADHLLRLQAVPILRQQGQRLDQIRELFGRLSTDEIRRVVNAAHLPPDFLSGDHSKRSAPPGQSGSFLASAAPAASPGSSQPMYRVGQVRELRAGQSPAVDPHQEFIHYPLADGVTLVVSWDLSKNDDARVAQLLAAARQIFSKKG